MFLLGYIAAPPTMTVFSPIDWAKAGDTLMKPSVSAATAAVVSAALRLRLMKILQKLDDAHDWVRDVSYGGSRLRDAGSRSQFCELAARDHRAGRQTRWRTALRL